jgi:hypothetical protein
MKPIGLDDAYERGLVTELGKGVLTFSNGSEWDSWSTKNCARCKFFDPGAMGALCAFEAAAFMHIASPELVRMFGWIEDAEHPGEFDKPETCAFFKDKDDRDEDRPSSPPTDPRQLVLIADPTEDAALITGAPLLVEVEV